MSSSVSRTNSSRPARAGLPGAAAAACLLFALIVAAARLAGAAEVRIDVTKAAGKKIGIAIPAFVAKEGAEELALRQTLEHDLLTTGYFRVLPLDAALARQAEADRAAPLPDLAAWNAAGVELLLRVDLTRQGGRIVLTAALHDPATGSRLLAREERDAPAEGVRLVHNIADAVVRALTGEPSLALSRIAFTWSKGSGGTKRVCVVDYDGRNFRPVSPEGVLALYPAWFPDGVRLCYVTYRQGRPEIVVHNLKTGQVRSLAFFPGLNAFPEISPDGSQMLLTLSRDGNPEIYRMAVDGSELKRLTFSPAVEASPVWSPDQTQLAFVSDQSGGPQIYVAGSSGGRMRRVSFAGSYATSPDWSAKGNHIVFTALVEGTFQLFLLDPATGTQEQITFDAENKENPSWAPDGRHLVFSEGKAGAYRLTILDVESGERIPVTREKGSFTSPAWSP
jgi:TolB protein